MMKRFTGIGLVSLLSFGVLSNVNVSQAQTLLNLNPNLVVEIEGLKNQNGQVCASLFASSKGFPGEDDKVIKRQCIPASQNPMTITFDQLKTGSYAVVIMHDENQDDQFNRDVMGLPLEGFGFSQNPEVIDRAPKFGECVVFVAGAQTKSKINLKYM